MAAATKVVEKQELKMFRIFIFLTQKKKKPEKKRWPHNIGTGYSVENFYIKGKVVCSDHFHANCFEDDMMAWETHRRGET